MAPQNDAWRTGEVVTWNDERGFGFLRPDEGGADIFVHVVAFGRTGERPKEGDRVKYRIGKGRDGRPAATTAKIDEKPLTQIRFLPRLRPREARFAAAAALVVIALGAVIFGEAPPELLGPYVAMGAMSITLYRTDKWQSMKRGWRVPETTLHATDLVFGVIGGLLAQGWLGHKTAKMGYLSTTMLFALGHALLLMSAGYGEPSAERLESWGRALGLL